MENLRTKYHKESLKFKLAIYPMIHWRTSNVLAKLSYKAIVGFTNPIIHKISVDWRLRGYLNYFVGRYLGGFRSSGSSDDVWAGKHGRHCGPFRNCGNCYLGDDASGPVRSPLHARSTRRRGTVFVTA